MNRFPLTKFQKGMEAAAWVISADTLRRTLLSWGALPETVAIHFNAVGVADDWGGRWTALLLPVLLVVCCGIVSFCTRLEPDWKGRCSCGATFSQRAMVSKSFWEASLGWLEMK